MTLIETLVAVAIFAMIGALVFPSLDHTVAALSFRRAVARTETVLREARSEAIEKNIAVEMSTSPDGREIKPIGNTAQFRLEAATITMTPAAIIFYGDGSSSGGSVFVLARGMKQQLSIDPVSGAIGS